MKKVLTKIMGMIFTFFILFRSSCFADLIDDRPRPKEPLPTVNFGLVPVIIVGVVVVAIIIVAIVIIVTSSKENNTTQNVETFGSAGNIENKANNENNENNDNKEIK